MVSGMSTDPLIAAARFLVGQLEWLRHAVDEQGQPYAVAAFAEIGHCAGRLRGLVNGPAEQRYLGPCGATVIAPAPPQDGCDCGHEGLDSWFHLKPCPVALLEQRSACDGDVYGIRGAQRGRCRTCGAEVAQDDRRAWLDGEVRAGAFRAYEIADAYRISADTIRSWAHRGRLRSYFRTDEGLIAAWVDPPDGEVRERLHYVGDVLDLAAADAARRETARAQRERRKENAA